MKRKHTKRNLRNRIIERDKGICQLCRRPIESKSEMRIDHKIPVSQNGPTKEYNLWLLCERCDKRKAAKLRDDLVREYLDTRIKQLKKKLRRA